MLNYSTEYLILHEDEMDWDKLSSNPDDSFSLIEVRLFRSRINWKKYIKSHLYSCPFTVDILEVGSKYFSDCIYKLLSSFGIAPQDFIDAHIEKFDIEDVILNCRVDQRFLMETAELWARKDNIVDIFKKSKFIDLNDPTFSEVKLLLEMD